MRLLLDTHVLLWWLDDPRHIAESTRNLIEAGDNLVFVSAAVIWEMVIKSSVGKLTIPKDLQTVLKLNNFQPLSVSINHALLVETLPNHHHDPFDRILIAQAIAEGFTLITRDSNIIKYSVSYMVA